MNRNDIRGKWHKTEEKYCPVEKTEEKYYPVEYCEKENLGVFADAFLIEEAKDYVPEAFLAFVMSKCFLQSSYEGKFWGFNQALLNRRKIYAPYILGAGTPWNFRRYRTEAESVAIMHGIGSLWMIYKQAYRFDADFMEELNKTESLLELPVSVFENLPYPCFYLDLEDQDLFQNMSAASLQSFGNQILAPQVSPQCELSRGRMVKSYSRHSAFRQEKWKNCDSRKTGSLTISSWKRCLRKEKIGRHWIRRL